MPSLSTAEISVLSPEDRRAHFSRVDKEKNAKRMEYQRAWRLKNKARLREIGIAYKANNREYFNGKSRAARAKKAGKVTTFQLRGKRRCEKRRTHGEYSADRRKIDPAFKTMLSMRTRVAAAVRRDKSKKASGLTELLGCSPQELKRHIEKQWKAGMSWENYGRKGWHIDHIKPCAAFKLTDPAQQILCFHFSNLQPLWWIENLTKAARFDAQLQTN